MILGCSLSPQALGVSLAQLQNRCSNIGLPQSQNPVSRFPNLVQKSRIKNLEPKLRYKSPQTQNLLSLKSRLRIRLLLRLKLWNSEFGLMVWGRKPLTSLGMRFICLFVYYFKLAPKFSLGGDSGSREWKRGEWHVHRPEPPK